MKLTKEQLLRLWEENFNMKFWYHYDEIKQEKRPFGNSGYSQIFKDIKEKLGLKFKFEAESEDEISDKIYDFVQDIFEQMINLTKGSDELYEVKIVKKKENSESS